MNVHLADGVTLRKFAGISFSSYPLDKISSLRDIRSKEKTAKAVSTRSIDSSAISFKCWPFRGNIKFKVSFMGYFYTRIPRLSPFLSTSSSSFFSSLSSPSSLLRSYIFESNVDGIPCGTRSSLYLCRNTCMRIRTWDSPFDFTIFLSPSVFILCASMYIELCRKRMNEFLRASPYHSVRTERDLPS